MNLINIKRLQILQVFVFIFIVNLASVSFSASAQDVEKPKEDKKVEEIKYLFVDPPIVPKKEAFWRAQISKLALKIIYKQKHYQMMMSPPANYFGVKMELYRLEMKVFENKTDPVTYRIKMTLYDAKKDDMHNQIEVSNIPRRMVLLQARISLYELFHGAEIKDKESVDDIGKPFAKPKSETGKKKKDKEAEAAALKKKKSY